MTSPSLPEINPERLTEAPITAELVTEEKSAKLTVAENPLQARESIDYNFVNRPLPAAESSPPGAARPILTLWSLGGILCLMVANGLLTWQQALPPVSPPPQGPGHLVPSAAIPDPPPLALNQLSELTPIMARSPEPASTAPSPPASPASLANLLLPPSLQPQTTGLVAAALPADNLPTTPVPPAPSLPTLALRPVYSPASNATAPLPPPPPPTLPVSALPPVDPLGTKPNLDSPSVYNPQPPNPAYTASPPSVPQLNPAPSQPPVPPSSFNYRTRQTLIKQYNRGMESSSEPPNHEAQQLIQELENLNQAP